MDYKLVNLSPTVSSSSQIFATNGLLGNTIEEKTRQILGWTEHTAPSMTNGPLPPAAHVSHRKADKSRKTKSASISASAPYPYSLLASNDSSRGRKSSCPSLCNMNCETAILRQQLTPPPSPVSTLNGVSIVSLPRQERSPPTLPPPPPAYHTLPVHYTNRKMTCNESILDHSVSSPNLPISPISPAAPSGLLQAQDGRTSSRISTSEVFERLRKEVPHLPKEQSKFRILVQTVANVIELETKLAHLQEQTRTLSNILSQSSNAVVEFPQQQQTYPQIAIDTSAKNGSPSPVINECPPMYNAITDVPDDLRGIDVTAFKSMMCSPQSFASTPSFQNSVSKFKSNSYGGDSYLENNYDCESFANLNYNGLDPLLVDTSY